MPYTLLHISDLHRSPEDPIGNEALLSSLVSDFARAQTETPSFCNPDAIIVSGDVIQGAPLNDPHHAHIVEEQYNVALQLLESLTDRFLDGDHTRVVIVPGNHDVEWNVAYSAMQAVDDADLSFDIRPSDFGPTKDLRWNWKERKAYRVVDRDLYNKRLEHYRRFIAKFYENASLAWPMDVNSDYWLFELYNGRIGIAAFNSCDGNDCFAYHGAIAERSLAQAHMDLYDRSSHYDLMMAVWHHNMEGPPGATDYMDIAAIYNLIGNGFRLGLHGHQHRAQTSNRILRLPQQEPMAVISAGSLCAGPKELPTGVNRQYNVLEISDDCSSVRVHVREMAIGTVFAPARRPEFGAQSYIDIPLGKPLSAQLPRRDKNDPLILAAEAAISEGTPDRALQLLSGVPTPPGSYARTLAIKAASAANEWSLVVKTVTPPRTIDELVSLISAHVELSQFDHATEVLDNSSSELDLSSVTQVELRRFVAARRSLSGRAD